MLHRTRTVFALALAACGPATELAPAGSDADGSEYLFDATAEQIEAVAADLDLDPDLLLERMTAFDCVAWGDMCSLVGPDRAFEIAALEWELALSGADRDTMDAELALVVDAAIEDRQAESEGLRAFDTTSRTYPNPTDSNERIRTEYGTVNPVFSRAYSLSDVRHERYTYVGTWAWRNDHAPNISVLTEDHVHYTHDGVLTVIEEFSALVTGSGDRQTARAYHDNPDEPSGCGWGSCWDGGDPVFYDLHQVNKDACITWDDQPGVLTCMY